MYVCMYVCRSAGCLTHPASTRLPNLHIATWIAGIARTVCWKTAALGIQTHWQTGLCNCSEPGYIYIYAIAHTYLCSAISGAAPEVNWPCDASRVSLWRVRRIKNSRFSISPGPKANSSGFCDLWRRWLVLQTGSSWAACKIKQWSTAQDYNCPRFWTDFTSHKMFFWL